MGVQAAELTKLIADLQFASDGAPMVEEVLDEVADEIFLYQTAYVPVRTGKLKGTIGIIKRPRYRFIGPDHYVAPYDVFVENDTKPHIIRPKRGKYLVFEINGKKIFAKEVHHPGTKAQPFAEPSLTRWEESLGDKLQEKVVRRIVDGQ